jgi:hypothetical protein
MALLAAGTTVKGLTRKGKTNTEITALREAGAQLIEVDYSNLAQLVAACAGGDCVVSALSGLREVIVDAQTHLLKAAVEAGVPHFIPSDFCIDYTKNPPGTNRNLDLRREFNQRLDKEPIQATSILNGMFTDLLTGQAPVVLFGIKRIFFWGAADQPLDFTTMDDTAAYTAAAALDSTIPRYLRIAGEVATVRDLQATATQLTGKPFGLLRPGGLGAFQRMINFTKTVAPGKGEVFPAWQGMQYLHDMFTGLPKLHPLDNDRYPGMKWTSVKEVLKRRDA